MDRAKKNSERQNDPVRLTVVVHSLREASAALAAAASYRAEAVLISPPGAAAAMGVGYFRALVELAARERPQVPIAAVIDCGDDPGHALAALRMGFKRIVLGGHKGARARVAAIAAQYGARLVARPRRALDLLRVDDAEAACRAFLSGRELRCNPAYAGLIKPPAKSKKP